jgi:hypothetical protein
MVVLTNDTLIADFFLPESGNCSGQKLRTRLQWGEVWFSWDSLTSVAHSRHPLRLEWMGKKRACGLQALSLTKDRKETNVGVRVDEVCTVKRKKRKRERFRWSNSFASLFCDILFKSKSLLGECSCLCFLPSGQ